jgi:type II secretory pathway component PulK
MASCLTLTTARRRRARPKRSGIVLLAVLVILAVSLTLFGIWARQAVLNRGQLDTQQRRLQAVRLAEAGLKRAIALRAADSKFEEQVWSVPPSDLDQTHAGTVRMAIAPGSSKGTLRYQATAEFPVGEVRSIQITKAVELAEPTSKDRS